MGAALAPLLLVPLERVCGWRAVFWVMGAVGVIWAFIWSMWFPKEPEGANEITQDELQNVAAPSGLTSLRSEIPWRRLLASPQLWLIMTAYFFYAWGSCFFFGWFTTWMVRGEGFSLEQMGIFASFPFLMAMFGNLIGGSLSRSLVLRMGEVSAYRWITASCIGFWIRGADHRQLQPTAPDDRGHGTPGRNTVCSSELHSWHARRVIHGWCVLRVGAPFATAKKSSLPIWPPFRTNSSGRAWRSAKWAWHNGAPNCRLAFHVSATIPSCCTACELVSPPHRTARPIDVTASTLRNMSPRAVRSDSPASSDGGPPTEVYRTTSSPELRIFLTC